MVQFLRFAAGGSAGSPRHLRDIVLGVVRDGHLLRIGAPEVDAIEASDRLLYIRHAGH